MTDVFLSRVLFFLGDAPVLFTLADGRMMMLRIGCGFDVHAFADGRRLVLAGVTVPHSRGLAGHSDADVAVHALIDALLGALALGDIGGLFPDHDPAHKDADSMDLLRQTFALVRRHKATVVNADMTIAVQLPTLAPYLKDMRHNLATCLQIPPMRVSVKATTTERLGFVGREEGAAAYAVVLVNQEEETASDE